MAAQRHVARTWRRTATSLAGFWCRAAAARPRQLGYAARARGQSQITWLVKVTTTSFLAQSRPLLGAPTLTPWRPRVKSNLCRPDERRGEPASTGRPAAIGYRRPISIAIDATAIQAIQANIPKKATVARDATPATTPSQPSQRGTALREAPRATQGPPSEPRRHPPRRAGTSRCRRSRGRPQPAPARGPDRQAHVDERRRPDDEASARRQREHDPADQDQVRLRASSRSRGGASAGRRRTRRQAGSSRARKARARRASPRGRPRRRPPRPASRPTRRLQARRRARSGRRSGRGRRAARAGPASSTCGSSVRCV